MIDHVQIRFIGLAPACGCSHAQVLLNRQVFERLAAFQDLNNTGPRNGFRRLIVNGLAVIEDRSVSHFTIFRFEQAGNSFQGRGLACTIAAQQGNDMLFFYGQRYPFQNLDDIGINHGNIVHLK